MLKTVISPQKQKLESLPQAIEEWMDAVKTYEKRRDAAGNRTSIPDQIKTAALEAMLLPDLESHVQLNRARFTTFDTLADQSSLGDPTFMPWRLQTPSARRALLPARASKRNEILGTRSIPIFERTVLHRRRTSVCVCVCGQLTNLARLWQEAS